MTQDRLLQAASNAGDIGLSRTSSLPLVRDDTVPTKALSDSWGLFPLLSLTSALGLLLLAFADSIAYNDASSANTLFWIGLLVLFVPIAVRLVSQEASRKERIALLCVVGFGLYFAKVLHNPTAMAFHDEFLHWKTANDIDRTGHLFTRQSLLPVSPLYPGLEIVTDAIQRLSGLSIFEAGLVLIGAARLVLVLSLYRFYEEIGSSARIAGLATLLYMTNEHFLFFDAMYSYESLALPLAAMIIFALVKRRAYGDYTSLNLAVVIGLGAVVATHHITSYVLAIFLVLWTLMPTLNAWARELFLWYVGERTAQTLIKTIRMNPPRTDDIKRGDTLNLAWIAAFSLIINLGWLAYIGNIVFSYLSPLFTAAMSDLYHLLTSEATTRQLFQDYSGEAAPAWERITSIVTLLLILVIIPLGMLQIWRRYRSSLHVSVITMMALGAIAYPMGVVLRLTKGGADVSNRSTAFLFLPIAFVLAVGLASLRRHEKFCWRIHLAITGFVTVAFVGGIIGGAGPIWMRLPGPYLVGAEARSIDPIGICAADWAKSYLGPNNRIATDRINRLLMGSYGEQQPITNLGDKVDVSLLFFSESWDSNDAEIVQNGNIKYLVVDLRLSTGLPRVGIYFEEGEPDGLQHTVPINASALAKFDNVEKISRVFDSGDLVIYDVGDVSGEP